MMKDGVKDFPDMDLGQIIDAAEAQFSGGFTAQSDALTALALIRALAFDLKHLRDTLRLDR
jgi:hypothetical protein